VISSHNCSVRLTVPPDFCVGEILLEVTSLIDFGPFLEIISLAVVYAAV
jgi:hypothetical protein